MATGPVRRAFAFAPGHVTGLFVPDLAGRDPRARGSRGAGVVLELGATAEVVSVESGAATLDVVDAGGAPLPITLEAARHLVGDVKARVRVRVTHALPIGQGFGMSAAGTLAATLALARIATVPARRAVDVAHLAELFGGGGLGGVAAILEGGVEVRTVAGVPPFGKIFHRPFDPPMLVGVIGRPLATPAQLVRPRLLAKVGRIGTPLLDGLGTTPAPEAVLAASERFTDRLGHAPAPLRRALTGLRRRGCWAAQAMFGRSFFAVPRDPRARTAAREYLREAGIDARELRAAPDGAHLLEGAGRADASILTGLPSRRQP